MQNPAFRVTVQEIATTCHLLVPIRIFLIRGYNMIQRMVSWNTPFFIYISFRETQESSSKVLTAFSLSLENMMSIFPSHSIDPTYNMDLV